MNRRDFLRTGLAGAAGAAAASTGLFAACRPAAKPIPELKISFQEKIAPGETLAEKFDFMEAHGVVGFEPHGRDLAGRVTEIQDALKGRNISVTAICAGFKGFILAEEAEQRDLFDTTMRELIVLAGELGSVGVIMVPAFNRQQPVMPHTAETRQYLVERMHELGEFALSHHTSVILEPLNRREAFYLRLLADASSICRDADSDGVRCLGDFWHMTHEEVSDYGAFFSAGKYLNHVHIASRGNRRMPGEDGPLDDYTDGFRALQEMNYGGYVSFECGTKQDRNEVVPAAVKLLNDQWYGPDGKR